MVIVAVQKLILFDCFLSSLILLDITLSVSLLYFLKSKFIADLRSSRRWILENVQYLEAQKEFGAHIWSDCSTHEYIQTSKYEGQTPSELEDRDDLRFGPEFFS